MSQPSVESVVTSTGTVIPGVQPPTRVPPVARPADAVRSSEPDRVFTSEDIERARQQEKDKLYSRVEELRLQLDELRAEREQVRSANDGAQRQADEEARRQAESETDLRTLLAQKESEWQTQLERERQQREQAFAILEKERELADLDRYRQQKLREFEDDILPELRDDVRGSSPEEIDGSITRLVQVSESILKNAADALQRQRQQMAGSRVTSPMTTPLENTDGSDTLSAEQINAMSMEQWAQVRGQLGVTGGRTNRGLFG